MMSETMFVKKCPICDAELILQRTVYYESPILRVEQDWLAKAEPAAEGGAWWVIDEEGDEYDSTESLLRCDSGHTADEMLTAIKT